MRTLLLNSNGLPLKVIPWERALKMRYEGNVDIVVEYDEEVRSPSVTWRVPAVIRLRREHRVKHVVRFSRGNVFLRDKFRCQYCGQRFDERDLTYDHVVPYAHGGKTSWTNIVTACRPCNYRKGSRECDECGMFPLNKPVRPKSLPSLGPRIDRASAPIEWLAYLPVAA